MPIIKNHPKRTNSIIKAIRGTLEHRAAWLYLLLDEAEKRGIATEEFAKTAILRCGCLQGDHLVAEAGTKSLRGLKKTLFTLPARMVFEMKVVTCTDDRLGIDFHYCPLVAAWQSHGATTVISSFTGAFSFHGGFGQNPCKGKAPFLREREFTQDSLHYPGQARI